MAKIKSNSRLSLQITAELRRTIEAAAAELGQSAAEFAISTLRQTAARVISERNVTRLTQRDWQRFLRAINDDTAKPNRALFAAAQRYKKQVRS